MKGLWYDKKLQQRTEIHSDNSFLVSFICLYLCAVLLYFATLSLYHREKKGSAKSVHASYKQFVIVKQETQPILPAEHKICFILGAHKISHVMIWQLLLKTSGCGSVWMRWTKRISKWFQPISEESQIPFLWLDLKRWLSPISNVTYKLFYRKIVIFQWGIAFNSSS